MVKNYTKWIHFLIAAGIYFLFFFLPPKAPLTKDGMQVLGIFFASLYMWITISIDWPSLITLLLLGLVPSIGFNKVFSGSFGNSTVLFLLFTFMLVYPLSKTSFVKRCTIFFITNPIAKKGPWFFASFLFAAVTFMGLFISPSVLFLAFMPFLEDIIAALDLKKGSKAANMLMMGSAFAISLSSGMTLIAHVWPTMALGALNSTLGISIGQWEYMAFGIPTGIVILVLMILMFRFIYRPKDFTELPLSRIEELKKELPKPSRKEIVILATLIITVLLWVVPSLLKNAFPNFYSTINAYTTAFPPLIGCILLFLIHDDGKPILSFKSVLSEGVLWGAIFMTGAATILGSAITSDATGISAFLEGILKPLTAGLSPFLLASFFVVWTILETNFSSNIVTTTVVSGVALLVLPAAGNGVVIPAVLMLIGFGAAICNMTPAGQSTINTVAIGSGYTKARDMLIWGGIFAIAATLVLCLLGYPLASFLV